jgi:hypothetical protein
LQESGDESGSDYDDDELGSEASEDDNDTSDDEDEEEQGGSSEADEEEDKEGLSSDEEEASEEEEGSEDEEDGGAGDEGFHQDRAVMQSALDAIIAQEQPQAQQVPKQQQKQQQPAGQDAAAFKSAAVACTVFVRGLPLDVTSQELQVGRGLNLGLGPPLEKLSRAQIGTWCLGAELHSVCGPTQLSKHTMQISPCRVLQQRMTSHPCTPTTTSC